MENFLKVKTLTSNNLLMNRKSREVLLIDVFAQEVLAQGGTKNTPHGQPPKSSGGSMFLGVNCTINKRCFIPPTLTEPKMVDVDKMIENGKENFYPAYS